MLQWCGFMHNEITLGQPSTISVKWSLLDATYVHTTNHHFSSYHLQKGNSNSHVSKQGKYLGILLITVSQQSTQLWKSTVAKRSSNPKITAEVKGVNQGVPISVSSFLYCWHWAHFWIVPNFCFLIRIMVDTAISIPYTRGYGIVLI